LGVQSDEIDFLWAEPKLSEEVVFCLTTFLHWKWIYQIYFKLLKCIIEFQKYFLLRNFFFNNNRSKIDYTLRCTFHFFIWHQNCLVLPPQLHSLIFLVLSYFLKFNLDFNRCSIDKVFRYILLKINK
jgi:hypothetical protein